MAQGDLYQLLVETRQLLAVDSEWYRTFLNIQPHRYVNSVRNVTREFIKEVGADVYSTHKSTFDKLLREYVATLYKRIAKTKRSAYEIQEEPGSNDKSFSILITPIQQGSVGPKRMSGNTLIYESVGSDPFKRIINDEKRAALKPLLNAVNVLLGTDYTSSTFFDTGHAPLGVVEKQTYTALSSLKDSIELNPETAKLVKASGVLARLKLSSKWIAPASKTLIIEVTDESFAANRSKASNEKAFKDNTKKALESIINKNKDWADQRSSDSVLEAIEKTLVNQAVKRGAKVKGGTKKIDRSSATVSGTINYASSAEEIIDGGFKKKQKARATQGSPAFDLSLVGLLNAKLPPAVRANMGYPALQNRTGRFSESVKVVDVQTTPQGYPSLGYTYQRSPYDVFDPTLGRPPWNTPGRDPKLLIEKSIRDIAREMAIGRFYLRRV